MKNELALIRVSDNHEIHATSLSVPMDVDSWSGNFSASIPSKSALELVKTIEAGVPIVVESQINGYAWRWIVEDWSWNRKFNGDSITISGRSLVALMAERYIAPRNYVENETYTIAQLAERELIEGWTLNWMSADWSVPAGNWQYTGRPPIEAISRLAASSGSALIPHRTEQQIIVKPRYSVMPWNYYDGLVTPDVTIPIDAMLSQSRSFKGSVEVNGVYMYGMYSGGILAFVKITGTAGDKLITNSEANALITHVDGARAMGSRLLAGSYQSPEIGSFTIPLGGDDFPLIELTSLVSITEGEEDIRGCVSSVNINAKLEEVTQTVTLGENSNNVWKRFSALLPADPLLIATVLTRDTEANTSEVSPIGGGVIKVRGTGVIGNKVYIRSGRIEGPAPEFTNNYEIEV